MEKLAAAEMFLLTLVGCGLLSCLVCSLIAPLAVGALRHWEPTRRHVALVLLAAAPALLTAACFLTLLSPSILSLFVPALDHCLVHDDGHAHLCFAHLPQHAPHPAIWVCSAFLFTLLAFAAAESVRRVASSARVARGLLRTSTKSDEGVHVLESVAVLCATVGLLRPRVVVSRQVLESLPDLERRALIAHEQSHARRHDALSRMFVRLATLLYPRSSRLRIAQELDLAAEQACDEAAAHAVGDRLTVAEAIVRIERMMSGVPLAQLGMVAVGMGQLAIEQRVHSLVHPPLHPGAQRGALIGWLLLSSALLIGMFAASDFLHHAVESLLSPWLQ